MTCWSSSFSNFPPNNSPRDAAHAPPSLPAVTVQNETFQELLRNSFFDRFLANKGRVLFPAVQYSTTSGKRMCLYMYSSNIIHFNRVKTRLKNNIYVPVKQKMCTYCNSSNQGAKRLHLSLILTPNFEPCTIVQCTYMCQFIKKHCCVRNLIIAKYFLHCILLNYLGHSYFCPFCVQCFNEKFDAVKDL